MNLKTQLTHTNTHTQEELAACMYSRTGKSSVRREFSHVYDGRLRKNQHNSRIGFPMGIVPILSPTPTWLARCNTC